MSFVKENPNVLVFYAIIIVLTCIFSIASKGSEHLIAVEHYPYEGPVLVANLTNESDA